jgi:dTMP kinase
MDIIPNFAVFEGGDGSGTTTQLTLLKDRLKNTPKPPFFPTFEPTGGQIGGLIRAALKKEIPIRPETLAMLFASDRNEHLYSHGGVLERANNGELVVSDRYVLSSLVYQGLECGDDLAIALNSRFPAPEVTIFFDIDPDIALDRMRSRGQLEIYEYRDFQVKVREKYLSLLEIYRNLGAHIEIIDASKSAEEVREQVWSIVSQLPIINQGENSI